MRIIRPQNRPPDTLCFDERQLHFRSHDFKSALGRSYPRKQAHRSLVVFTITRVQIQLYSRVIDELDSRALLINLLQIHGRDDGRRRLVEVVADFFQLLFLCVVFFLLAPDKEVLGFGRAAGDSHEFVEFEHALFAAGPAFAAFVEQRLAGVVDAGFVSSTLTGFVCSSAAFSFA